MNYTLRQYRNRLEKLQALEAEINRLQTEADRVKQDIQADMGDAEHVDGDTFRISWTRVLSSRFDTKRFHAEHASLYGAYVRPTECRRFTYTLER